MPEVRTSRTIAAPVDRVFDIIAHIESFSEALPHIVRVEFLGEHRRGVGTRFRETRLMKGREASTELEVTEYVENDRVRLVADSHGTVWDTVFTVRAVDGGTELGMVMEARARSLVARLANRLVMGMVTKAVESDMDAVKAYCEGAAPDRTIPS